MGPMLKLGVLDQSPVATGGSAADSVHETLELAQAAERLGYQRYWLAEHHATPGLAGSCPEILIGQGAARTSRIRVGSGGVMLSHYSALKVAESFRMLELLFPGRTRETSSRRRRWPRRRRAWRYSPSARRPKPRRGGWRGVASCSSCSSTPDDSAAIRGSKRPRRPRTRRTSAPSWNTTAGAR